VAFIQLAPQVLELFDREGPGQEIRVRRSMHCWPSSRVAEMCYATVLHGEWG
jgi:hypothetical protein